MPMWLWKQRLKPLAEFQIIFLTCKIRGCAVNLNYDTAPYFHHHFILYAALRGLFFPITTFWAYSIRIEGNPNGLGLVEWPTTNGKTIAPVLQIDANTFVKEDPNMEKRYEIMDGLFWKYGEKGLYSIRG